MDIKKLKKSIASILAVSIAMSAVTVPAYAEAEPEPADDAVVTAEEAAEETEADEAEADEAEAEEAEAEAEEAEEEPQEEAAEDEEETDPRWEVLPDGSLRFTTDGSFGAYDIDISKLTSMDITDIGYVIMDVDIETEIEGDGGGGLCAGFISDSIDFDALPTDPDEYVKLGKDEFTWESGDYNYNYKKSSVMLKVPDGMSIGTYEQDEDTLEVTKNRNINIEFWWQEAPGETVITFSNFRVLKKGAEPANSWFKTEIGTIRYVVDDPDRLSPVTIELKDEIEGWLENGKDYGSVSVDFNIISASKDNDGPMGYVDYYSPVDDINIRDYFNGRKQSVSIYPSFYDGIEAEWGIDINLVKVNKGDVIEIVGIETKPTSDDMWAPRNHDAPWESSYLVKDTSVFKAAAETVTKANTKLVIPYEKNENEGGIPKSAETIEIFVDEIPDSMEIWGYAETESGIIADKITNGHRYIDLFGETPLPGGAVTLEVTGGNVGDSVISYNSLKFHAPLSKWEKDSKGKYSLTVTGDVPGLSLSLADIQAYGNKINSVSEIGELTVTVSSDKELWGGALIPYSKEGHADWSEGSSAELVPDTATNNGKNYYKAAVTYANGHCEGIAADLGIWGGEEDTVITVESITVTKKAAAPKDDAWFYENGGWVYRSSVSGEREPAILCIKTNELSSKQIENLLITLEGTGNAWGGYEFSSAWYNEYNGHDMIWWTDLNPSGIFCSDYKYVGDDIGMDNTSYIKINIGSEGKGVEYKLSVEADPDPSKITDVWVDNADGSKTYTVGRENIYWSEGMEYAYEGWTGFTINDLTDMDIADIGRIEGRVTMSAGMAVGVSTAVTGGEDRYADTSPDSKGNFSLFIGKNTDIRLDDPQYDEETGEITYPGGFAYLNFGIRGGKKGDKITVYPDTFRFIDKADLPESDKWLELGGPRYYIQIEDYNFEQGDPTIEIPLKELLSKYNVDIKKLGFIALSVAGDRPGGWSPDGSFYLQADPDPDYEWGYQVNEERNFNDGSTIIDMTYCTGWLEDGTVSLQLRWNDPGTWAEIVIIPIEAKNERWTDLPADLARRYFYLNDPGYGEELPSTSFDISEEGMAPADIKSVEIWFAGSGSGTVSIGDQETEFRTWTNVAQEDEFNVFEKPLSHITLNVSGLKKGDKLTVKPDNIPLGQSLIVADIAVSDKAAEAKDGDIWVKTGDGTYSFTADKFTGGSNIRFNKFADIPISDFADTAKKIKSLKLSAKLSGNAWLHANTNHEGAWTDFIKSENEEENTALTAVFEYNDDSNILFPDDSLYLDIYWCDENVTAEITVVPTYYEGDSAYNTWTKSERSYSYRAWSNRPAKGRLQLSLGDLCDLAGTTLMPAQIAKITLGFEYVDGGVSGGVKIGDDEAGFWNGKEPEDTVVFEFEDGVDSGNDVIIDLYGIDPGAIVRLASVKLESNGKEVYPEVPAITSEAGDAQVKIVTEKLYYATNYRVFYTLDNGVNYKKAAADNAEGVWTITGLKNGTEYKFLVLAYDGKNWSKYEKGECYAPATPKSDKPPMPAKVNSKAEAGKITVTCSTVTGAKTYRLFYTLDKGKNYKKVGDTDTRKWVLTDVKGGTEYGFMVLAYNGTAWSGYTKGFYTAAVKAVAAGIEKPAKVNAVAGAAEVTVTCSTVKGAKTYRLFYTLDNGKKYVKVGDTADRKWKVTGLKANVEYKFLVLAYDGKSWSKYQKGDYQAAATPSIAKPKTIKPTAAGSGKITVACSAVEGAKNYKLFYTTDNGKSYKQVGNSKARKWTITGLKAGTYKFLVLASDGKNWSKYTKGECYSAITIK